MKKLLLIAALTIAFGNSTKAQDCIGYIPENAIVLCDTFTPLYFGNNSEYWVTNDTAAVGITGNNNTLYYTGYRNHISIGNMARNNIVYMQGAKIFAMIRGNSNTLYVNGASVIFLYGDSNRVYGKNINVHFVSSTNNLVVADTINILGNTGSNNITDTNSMCSSIQISTLQAPPNLCGQTTNIIEAPINITVYPNPAIDNVTFSVQNVSLVKVITLYDVTGKTVEVIANVGSDKVTIDTSRLGAGIYVYAIMLANGKTERGKLLVG